MLVFTQILQEGDRGQENILSISESHTEHSVLKYLFYFQMSFSSFLGKSWCFFFTLFSWSLPGL